MRIWPVIQIEKFLAKDARNTLRSIAEGCGIQSAETVTQNAHSIGSIPSGLG